MSAPSDIAWFGDLAAGTGAASTLPQELRDALTMITWDKATELASVAADRVRRQQYDIKTCAPEFYAEAQPSRCDLNNHNLRGVAVTSRGVV